MQQFILILYKVIICDIKPGSVYSSIDLAYIKYMQMYIYLLTKCNIWLYSLLKIDAAVHSEHVQVIRRDNKQESVERSIDLYQRRYTLSSSQPYFQYPPPIKIGQFSSGIHLYPILRVLNAL
jgi:hypothetical protein